MEGRHPGARGRDGPRYAVGFPTAPKRFVATASGEARARPSISEDSPVINSVKSSLRGAIYRGFNPYPHSLPPETGTTAPVMNDAAGDARKTATDAISSGLAV